MIPLPRVTFVIDRFAAPSPGQQLLDRFLIGYHSDGAFRAPGSEVLLDAGSGPAVEARRKDYGLRVAGGKLGEARALVIAAREDRVRGILAQAPSGARVFVYGLLSPAAAELARQRGIVLLGGTASGTAFRLPSTQLAEDRLRKCVVGTFGPDAVIDSLEALRSIAESRLQRLEFVRAFVRGEVWQQAYSAEWGSLFSAALTRSNTIQGDPDRDGRTQDIAGLRLVEKLVRNPRAWLLAHGDGLRTMVFDLSGAIEDLNFCVEERDGSRHSAQLYRPPAPMSDHFSRLAEQVERFFRADLPEVPRGLENLWTAAEKMNA